MFWSKLSHQAIKHKVFEALSKNANYRTENVLGVPGTFLDTEVFYDDAPFLKDAPFLSTLIANPNHIGVHTFGDEHEEFFAGTQELEKDLLRICAEEIFKAEKGSYDGYVAPGGTEANIQAMWIYRNYFKEEFDAKRKEMAVISSVDTHYSIAKGCDLLGLRPITIKVHDDSRELIFGDLEHQLNEAIHSGVKYFIVVLNMSTTMFGSVDDIEKVTDLLDMLHVNYKLHVDAAYGGFIYPFTNSDSKYHFQNKDVSSISIDGHKILQAPYGTGIFMIRKELMKYVCTDEAQYVSGKDYTLCGSRSGANAICVWMILNAHGSVGWSVKMAQLLDKTNNVCAALDEMGVEYYRHPNINIITMRSRYITPEIAKTFYLVPDTHDGDPAWYKIVVMPHVKQGILDNFLNQLSSSLLYKRLSL